MDTPMEVNHGLCSTEELLAERRQYQKLGGKLIYLTISRLDIAYAVSVVSRLMHSPR